MKLEIISVFVKKLYSLINDEENNILNALCGINIKNIGFSIIDNYSFHKKCIEKSYQKQQYKISFSVNLIIMDLDIYMVFGIIIKITSIKIPTYLNKIKI